MFLEEQFGDHITPIETPRVEFIISKKSQGQSDVKGEEDDQDESEDSDDEMDPEELEAAERARLADLGIPVPGLEIKVDKHIAKLWLDTLEVECANAVLRDRVRAVVERAVETVAPMWTVSMAQR